MTTRDEISCFKSHFYGQANGPNLSIKLVGHGGFSTLCIRAFIIMQIQGDFLVEAPSIQIANQLESSQDSRKAYT